MASLLLADRVVTLRPVGASAGAAKDASRSSISYRELMRSWAWSEALWRAGLLTADVEGETAVQDVRQVHERIADDVRFSPLRSFLRDDLLEHERTYLDALAADVVKGGPDPGISVPIVAGLDRFASRHDLTCARAHPTSVAEKSEWALGTDRIAVGLPIFVQADADRLLHAREVLADVLGPLRSALVALASDLPSGVQRNTQQEVLNVAAEAYSLAFDRRRDSLFSEASNDEVRAIEGPVTVSFFRLPADAALTAGLNALEALGRPAIRKKSPMKGAGNTPDAPGLVVSPGTPIAAIAFKVVGKR